MSRVIVLPREIEKRLKILTSLKEESNGVLFYRNREGYCAVESIYMTGVGSEGYVQADSTKVRIINRFLEENPDYRFVKFHTHTKGTLVQFGEKYARQFSKGDISVIKEQFKHDPGFIAMLVTPETILLSGLDNPKLSVVENSETYEQNHENIELSLKKIADRPGIEQEKFKGTMKIR